LRNHNSQIANIHSGILNAILLVLHRQFNRTIMCNTIT